MTANVSVLYEDERVISAIQKLQQTGYGRFPVVHRASGQLVGILTQGDIIKGTLRKLDIDYRQREAAYHRSQHVFEDIASENTSIILRYTIKARDFVHGGEASSKIKRSLQNLGIRPEILRRVAIATYEAEMNLILHTIDGGKIRENHGGAAQENHGNTEDDCTLDDKNEAGNIDNMVGAEPAYLAKVP